MKRGILMFAAITLTAGPSLALDPASIDWSAIPAKTVTLFFPGTASYQWLRSPEHKKAQKETAAGQACLSCHKGEEEALGTRLVKEGPLEPAPLPGKSGVKPVSLQFAHDGEYLYGRAVWKTDMAREGRMHEMVRFDGKGWKWYGSTRQAETVRSGAQPPIYEDRFSIMLDDGKVPGFAQQGCWLTCHESLRDMPEEADPKMIAETYIAKVLKEHDVRKYLPDSRTDPSDWKSIKSPDELARLKAEGKFVELIQWRVARSAPVGMADDGYVLEYRLFDEGKSPFSWNIDRKTMVPKYMFDKNKTSFIAVRAEDFIDPAKSTALIRESNAVPYDANAGFKEGDILPGRLLSREDAKGSAADNDDFKGVWKEGTYTLVFKRKLDTGHALDDKALKVGGVYTVGFAVHDDNITTRAHQVSFPLTLGIGTKADLEAVALKQ